MKFGVTIKKIAASDAHYGSMYLQYNLMTSFLRESCNDRQTQVLFMQMLDNEHTRIRKLVEIK